MLLCQHHGEQPRLLLLTDGADQQMAILDASNRPAIKPQPEPRTSASQDVAIRKLWTEPADVSTVAKRSVRLSDAASTLDLV